MIFSKQRINTGRQLEFDLAKAVTILLMIWTHVFETISNYFEPSLSHINAYVRGNMFGAVTFMFCMGIGMSYTRHNSSREFLNRGFQILTIGLILIIVRDMMSWFLSIALFSRPQSLAFLALGVSNDILPFAGYAYMLVALLKHAKFGKWSILAIAVVMSILGTFLRGVQTDVYGIDQILGIFWGTYSECYFPLFNWFIFVAAGQCFGEIYQHLQNPKKFHIVSLGLGIILCAAYLFVSFKVEQNVFTALVSEIGLAHRPFQDAIVCIALNVSLISLFYFIAKVLPKKVMPVLTHPSKHINQYYCISWVLIFYSYILVFRKIVLTNDIQVLSAWLGVLVLTILIVIVWSRYLKEKTEAFFARRRVFWTVLVYAICIGGFVWAVCNYDASYFPNFQNGYAVK